MSRSSKFRVMIPDEMFLQAGNYFVTFGEIVKCGKLTKCDEKKKMRRKGDVIKNFFKQNFFFIKMSHNSQS